MTTTEEAAPIRWSHVVESLTQPYPVSVPMVLLVALVPFYIFIAAWIPKTALHAPAMQLDAAIPLQPAWAIVYGALYLFLIVLPVFIVRQPEHIRRTVLAYLMVWLTAFVCFFVYPTVAMRPVRVLGGDFGAWGLRALYDMDPPYNCFPSIHVAHSFVSALTCWRVHRRLGIVATLCAALVGVSTLFTKQHYVVDVVAGALLAFVAYVIFLRGIGAAPERERRVAPLLALTVVGIVGVFLGGYFIAYLRTR